MTDVVSTSSPTELTRQAAELAALRRMLDLSQNTFSLSIAECNSPALRNQLIVELLSSHPAIQTVSIPPKTVDVFGFVTSNPIPPSAAALFLVGLELSISSTDPTQQTIQSLNASRELWEQRFHCPIVLWLPAYAAQLLSTRARDLWRYRSHRFEFVNDQATALNGVNDRRPDDLFWATNLPKDEKLFRMTELEQRLADAKKNPSSALTHHTNRWRSELAELNEFLGSGAQAEHILQSAIVEAEQTGDLESLSLNCGNLGTIYQNRGNLGEAEVLHQKALAVYEKLGHLQGMASAYCNLGAIYQTRGAFDLAEAMYGKVLALNEKLRSLEITGGVYCNLGNIYLVRGKLHEAEDVHMKCLAIDEKLGNLDGVASQYCNLGNVYRARGDLDRAEAMHRRALDADLKLGRSAHIASNYANLGLIYEIRGDLNEAESMLRKALDINEKLGNLVGMASILGNLANVYQSRGELDQAEVMFRKALAIDERVGNLEGLASDYGSLGILSMKRGNVAEAGKNWIISRNLFAKIGDSVGLGKSQSWLDSLPPQFQAVLP